MLRPTATKVVPMNDFMLEEAIGMMYPFLTLDDQTEIVHSEMRRTAR